MWETLRLFAPSILFGIEVILCFPAIEAKILSYISNNQFFVIQLTVGIGFFLVSLIYQAAYVGKREKTLDCFYKTRHHLLQNESKRLGKKYRKKGFNIRMSVKLVKRPFIHFLEPPNGPLPKISILKPVLVTNWHTDNMFIDGERHLVLSINQGVSGIAYCKKALHYVDMTTPDVDNLNLNNHQAKHFEDIKFRYSCPIYSINLDTLSFSDNILGIVTIDSKDSGSEILIKNPEYFKSISGHIDAFSQYCSYIFLRRT